MSAHTTSRVADTLEGAASKLKLEDGQPAVVGMDESRHDGAPGVPVVGMDDSGHPVRVDDRGSRFGGLFPRECGAAVVTPAASSVAPSTIARSDVGSQCDSRINELSDDAPSAWEAPARIYEYTAAANPDLPRIPVVAHPAALHESGPSRVIPFDLSRVLGGGAGARTSPNLLASFVRIEVGAAVTTAAKATSQAYYVIRGSGETKSEHGVVGWSTGDLFVVPKTDGPLHHACRGAEAHGGAALYWIHDEPLLEYLGVEPARAKFDPTLFTRARLLASVEEIRHGPGLEHKNRLGVLLGNASTDRDTKTLTHVLWSLLNSIGPQSVQQPHRHNSVALDLAVSAPRDGSVYTLMGREIDAEGRIIDPIKVEWADGSVFVTPPGWWHSHHNESGERAWVLPIQDAGLYTNMRTLDIRFAPDEVELHRQGRIRGSAFAITNKQYGLERKMSSLRFQSLKSAALDATPCPATSPAARLIANAKRPLYDPEEESDDCNFNYGL